MTKNAVSAVLSPLIRAAAAMVVGPVGLAVAPTLTGACVWAGEKLSAESEIAKAAAETLTHVFGHLSGNAERRERSVLFA